MAYPAYLREKARVLRTTRNLTIDELAERLALPRSTIYYWVRDLPLERKGRHNPGQRRAALAMRHKHQLLRGAAYREGLESFDALGEEPGFRDFLCLYIAEGYKRNRNCVAIGNSDDAVIDLVMRWIDRLTHKRPVFSIQFHVDQDLGELRRFWSARLCLSPDAIRFQRKSDSGQMNGRQWRSRYGVLRATVHDTYFRARLQAWIDLLRSEWVQKSV
jgi:hypothetical protein